MALKLKIITEAILYTGLSRVIEKFTIKIVKNHKRLVVFKYFVFLG